MQWNLNPTKTSSQFNEQCGTFSVMETDPTSVKNVVLFSVMETDYSTPLITVCSETSNQQKRVPPAVNNVVLFFSYGDKLLNTFNYCMQWNLNPTKQLPLQWTMWYFFQLWNQILFQWTMWYFFQLWRHITKTL